MNLRCLVLTENVYWYVPVQDETKKNFDRLGSTRKQIRFEDYLLKKLKKIELKQTNHFQSGLKTLVAKNLINKSPSFSWVV